MSHIKNILLYLTQHQVTLNILPCDQAGIFYVM